MTALYKISEQYNTALQSMIEMDMDEQTINDTMEGLGGELEVKARNVAAHYLNLESDAKQIKDAISNMQARLKQVQSQTDFYKNYLRENMERTGISKIECPEFKITLRKPPQAVEVNDNLDPAYIVTKTTQSPDKNRIKADLKAGIEIIGASLIDGKAGLTIK
ncbi:siphovirus Gp157 family protein [Pseudoalteromonas marina]|uniref:siphovirus Gp157 family protein n=1 Tax=Pseudoalteromonas marina TaxID=267375 RepID=UPI003C5BE694